VRIGSPDSLRAEKAMATIRFARPGGDAVPQVGEVVSGGDDPVIAIRTEAPTRALHELTAWAIGRGIELERLEVTQPSLEDVYLELTRDE
jgi:ABC-2 type transport system ATP-binding protein